MPLLRITVDEKTVATISTHGREIIAINVGGTRVDDTYADISASGGVYDPDREREHLIFVDQMPVSRGQVVGIDMIDGGADGDRGRTIEELYPDSPAGTPPTPDEMKALSAEIRALPLQRPGYELAFVSVAGVASSFSTKPEDHGFMLSVLWTDRHPERASVSLRTFTIDSVEARGPSTDLARDHILKGTGIRLGLVV